MLFHFCPPAWRTGQNLNGFSMGSWQSVHKTWQHPPHCKIILLILTCADVGWWWRNYAKSLARLASPSLAETTVTSHSSVLLEREKEKEKLCLKISVQFQTFCSTRFVINILESVTFLMPNILADIIGCKQQQTNKQNITVHPWWTWWVALLAHRRVWQKQLAACYSLT